MARLDYLDEDEELKEDEQEFSFGSTPSLDMYEIPGPNQGNDPGVAAAVTIPSNAEGTAGFPEDDAFEFGPGVMGTDQNPKPFAEVQPTQPGVLGTDQNPKPFTEVQPTQPGAIDLGGSGILTESVPDIYSPEGADPTADLVAMQQASGGATTHADAKAAIDGTGAGAGSSKDQMQAELAGTGAGAGSSEDQIQAELDGSMGADPTADLVAEQQALIQQIIASGQAIKPGEKQDADQADQAATAAPDDVAEGPQEPDDVAEGPQEPAQSAPQASSRPSATQRAASPTDSVRSKLQEAIMGALSGGSRYDSEVVQNAAAVIESQMNKMRQEGYRGISEHMASRGLTGSSVEGREIGDYESDIQRYGQERLSNLEREQALAYSQDRNAAISQALGLEGMESNERMQQMALQLQREGMSADQAYRQASLALQREGMGADQAYRMAGLDLQKQGMAFDQEYRNRSLDMQGERWASDDAFRNASLDWQREMGLAGLDMDRERLDMSRDQMEADNGFRQRSLDLQEQGMSQDEAYRQAEQEFRQSSWQQEFDFDQERWGDQEEVARLNMLLQAYDAFGSNALAFLNGGGEGGMDPSTLDENWVAREDWEGKSGPHAAAAYRRWLEQEEIRKAMGGN